MAESGGALGRRMGEEARKLCDWMHKQALMPQASSTRVLPAKIDERWFAHKFCHGNMPGEIDDVWPMVKDVRLIMPLMILVSVPKALGHFFNESPWHVRGIDHNLV